MADRRIIEGVAAALPIANLDTDQIMPKQFLRGIDKSNLDQGLLYDLRFDGDGIPRPDFVLNRPEYAGCRILIGGENFGCGSSREHAVWGMLQYGIAAVVAPSFAEIFYSNAMNNRLLLAAVSQEDVDRFIEGTRDPAGNWLTIDVGAQTVKSQRHVARFSLSPRHHRMFMDDVDLLGSSLQQAGAIRAFEQRHWQRFPWFQGVAAKVRAQGAAKL